MAWPRTSICLNGMWQRSDSRSPDTPPSDGWQTVRVPEEFGDWERESAWYRLRFDAAEIGVELHEAEAGFPR